MFITLMVSLTPVMLGAAGGIPPYFIVCLVVGGGLLLISTVFGHHADGADAGIGMDADVDVGVDVDADVDLSGGGHVEVDAAGVDAHHGGGLSLTEWFSVNFLVYFIATFGLVGTVLSWMTGMASAAVLAWAVVCGLIIGQGVHQTLRYLKRTSGGRAVSAAEYLNKPARVTLAIKDGQRGEIALQVRERERFAVATARHSDSSFNVGDSVMVVAFANGTAEVMSKDEYEFLNKS